jgi:methionyl-tRNA formyltransferase
VDWQEVKRGNNTEEQVRIVLLCATRRGYLFLKKLIDLRPQAELIVFSFREESWEPPFLDNIRELTVSSGGQFHEAKQVGSGEYRSFWESTPIDIMFVVSWRYLIPPEIYRRPRLGTFVFHDSLLPGYRGFAPTVWAIINGEDHTGVTLFRIAEEVDAGDIVDQQRIPIAPADTIAAVMDRVTQTYLAILERNLDRLLEGNVLCSPQDNSQATYTCKRTPEDNRIDWTMSSERIYNLIRAVSTPYTGAYTYLSGIRMIVWSAQLVFDYRKYVGRVPGRVVEVRPGIGSVVLTGGGALLLTLVQLDGHDPVCASDVINSVTHTLGR